MTAIISNNTPLETYELQGIKILVKREDLSSPPPGPSFSKMRGVYAHMKDRPESVIGVLDTYHSKAGWAVSYAGKALGKKVVNFWPKYKADSPGVLRPQQETAQSMGAELVSLQAGRSAVLYHQAKKRLSEAYPENSYMMPNALKLEESVTENAQEVVRCAEDLPGCGTLVVSISSGTVASGVLLGFYLSGLLDNYDVVLHMGYSRSLPASLAYIESKTGLVLGNKVRFVDQNYGYKDQAKKGNPAPFPCNPYYDLKAWHWLDNPRVLNDMVGSGKKGNIVFWNIGE